MSKSKNRPSYLVSIIIPSYRRYDLLTKCLESIPDAFGDISYEIILVENGSPKEEKRDFLASYQFPRNLGLLKVVESSIKLGFADACNKGYRASSGALSFFLNNDVILEKGSGEKLVMDMDDPSVGVVGMKLLFPSESALSEVGLAHSDVQRPSGKIQHVGLSLNLHGQVIHMYLGWSSDNPRVSLIKEVFAVTGAALMTRRNLFQKANYFDPVFGVGTYEDVDFCMKIRELGLKVLVDVSAVGTHYTGATAEGYKIGYPLNQNKMIFEQRWYNKMQWDEWRFW